MADNQKEMANAILAITKSVTNKKVWAGIHAYMHGTILNQFDKAKHGGEARGVFWKPFSSPYYTRADGTEVPIYGGIPKVLGKGKVLGRLRGGKHRARPGDLLMQSTGLLKGALLADFTVTEDKVAMNTPLIYAGTQEAMRSWNFFTEDDVNFVQQYLQNQL